MLIKINDTKNPRVKEAGLWIMKLPWCDQLKFWEKKSFFSEIREIKRIRILANTTQYLGKMILVCSHLNFEDI